MAFNGIQKDAMFDPRYTISPQLAQILTCLEGLKHEIDSLPITPSVLSSLRKTAHLETIHYSTYIEGNRLSVPEIKEVIEKTGHFPGRERDEKEILG